MGVRSSCAASAVNCCSLASSWAMRSNRPFSAVTSGSTSGGTPAVSSGASDCGWRVATACPSWRSGRTEPRTAHQMPSASSGSAQAMGSHMLLTLAITISSRMDWRSPTRMRTSPLRPGVTNTRHSWSSTSLLVKPRLRRSVRGCSGALADRASNWPSCQSWNTTLGWYLYSSGASLSLSSSSSSRGCRRSRAAVWARWASSSSLTSCSVSYQARAAAAHQASSTSASTVTKSRVCKERGVRAGLAVWWPAPVSLAALMRWRPVPCGSPRRALSRSAPRPVFAAGGRCGLRRHCC